MCVLSPFKRSVNLGNTKASLKFRRANWLLDFGSELKAGQN
jgi:hypothetical protein